MKRRLVLVRLATISTLIILAPASYAMLDNSSVNASLLESIGLGPRFLAYDPDPANGALHEETWVELKWAPGDYAVSHHVYFGEELDDDGEGAFLGSTTETRFRVGSAGCPYPEGLISGTTYYWRIDEVNELHPDSPWKGNVWHFTVRSFTAHHPSPADGALHQQTWANLSWVPGDYAVSHDVYFGEDFDDVSEGAPGTFRGSTIESWSLVGFPGYPYPDGLVRGTTYYWRVDEINDAHPDSPWKGDVWSFRLPPRKAYNPCPADGAKSVDPNADLSWSAGWAAAMHYVYFGKSLYDVHEATGGIPQAATTYDPGPLEMGTTYYWRVDEFDGTNTHTGDVWSFTTIGRELADLEIMGPDEALAWSSTQYTAVAYYQDGSKKEVTASTIWSVEPQTYGRIDDNGVLTLEEVAATSEIMISARYTEDRISIEGQKWVLCIPRPRVGQTYHVDVANGDDDNDGLSPETAFATIHRGIDSAEDGDTVLVYPGLYAEEINFLGKAITVQGVATTAGLPVLENPGDFAVSFYYGEGPDSVLKNFVIRNSFMAIFIAGSSPTIANVTVVDNKYGIEAYTGAEPDISNSIFWNNTGCELFGCQARYSCIEQEGQGQGNIGADPRFADLVNGDYHLLGERGRYWPEHDVWVLDEITSPCVDGGDPAADPSAEPTPNGGRINMGAYGGTAYASMSERRWLDGDINHDGLVNAIDFAIMAENWLRCETLATNQPPSVNITSPQDGAVIGNAGATIIEAEAWDVDGSVLKVEFFVDGSKIGEDNDSCDGWQASWWGKALGDHSLTAKAADNDGATATSPVVGVTVVDVPPPEPCR